MRNYAADLAEYDLRAAPIAGSPLELFILRTPNDKRMLKANVALCESHLLDWLAEQDAPKNLVTLLMRCLDGSWIANDATGDTRLLALIQAVARTKENDND